MKSPCLICGTPADGPYCTAHRKPQRTHARTTSQRGYTGAHVRARKQLASTLPAPCGYCGLPIYPTDRWHAAHRIDGMDEAGWMAACPACNERHKRRH
jgi:hypothetical protein